MSRLSLIFFCAICICAVNAIGQECNPEYIFDAAVVATYDEIVDTNFPVEPMDVGRNTLMYRQNAFAWFNQTYGIDMDPNDPNDRMVLGGNAMLIIGKLHPSIRYTIYGTGVQAWPEWRGKFEIGNGHILDDFFLVAFTADTLVHGTWGGMAGMMIHAGDALVYGGYRLMVDDILQTEIQYDSPCPIMVDPMSGSSVVNCELFHPELGHGLAFGASKLVPVEGGMYHAMARNFMTFPKTRGDIEHDCAKCEFLTPL